MSSRTVRWIVESAEANVSAATNRLKMLKDGARKQELAQAELAVTQAKAEMENARNTYERRVRLYAQDAIAKEEVDQYETQKKVAEATYQTALERQKLMVEGPRTEEIRVADRLRAREAVDRLFLLRVFEELRDVEAGLVVDAALPVGDRDDRRADLLGERMARGGREDLHRPSVRGHSGHPSEAEGLGDAEP